MSHFEGEALSPGGVDFSGIDGKIYNTEMFLLLSSSYWHCHFISILQNRTRPKCYQWIPTNLRPRGNSHLLKPFSETY